MHQCCSSDLIYLQIHNKCPDTSIYHRSPIRPYDAATKPRDKHMTQAAAKKSPLSFRGTASFFTASQPCSTLNRKGLFLNRNNAAWQRSHHFRGPWQAQAPCPAHPLCSLLPSPHQVLSAASSFVSTQEFIPRLQDDIHYSLIREN